VRTRERHGGKTPFLIGDAIKGATAWQDFRFGFRPTPLTGAFGGVLGGIAWPSQQSSGLAKLI
jgi:hypothetical protein